MDKPTDLEDFKENPIVGVKVEFNGTSTEKTLLKKYAQQISRSNTVLELNRNIKITTERLKALGVYRSCDILVLPGPITDSALVHFSIKDAPWWGIDLNFFHNKEGGKGVISGLLKNIRGKADLTKFCLGYKPNTSTFEAELIHHDKMYYPGKWEGIYSIKNYSEVIDRNVTERNYGGSFSLKSVDGKNIIEAGRCIRTNYFAIEPSSSDIMKTELPVTPKSYIAYTYLLDNRENKDEPRTGSFLKCINEVAFGEFTKFYRFDCNYMKIFQITSNLSFQTSLLFGSLFEWKAQINDRYKTKFVKGFDFLKENPLGSSSMLNLEAKLLFYNIPSFGRIGKFIPFMYGNLLYPDLIRTIRNKELAKNQIRGSLGAGVQWSTSYGKIELSYAFRTLSKPGDIVPEVSWSFIISE